MVARQHKVYRGLSFQKISASEQIPNIFSNSNESLKFLKEDVFAGQMTTAVLDAFKEVNICIVKVPANMTKFYQPIDLTGTGYCKRLLKRKFKKWYSGS